MVLFLWFYCRCVDTYIDMRLGSAMAEIQEVSLRCFFACSLARLRCGLRVSVAQPKITAPEIPRELINPELHQKHTHDTDQFQGMICIVRFERFEYKVLCVVLLSSVQTGLVGFEDQISPQNYVGRFSGKYCRAEKKIRTKSILRWNKFFSANTNTNTTSIPRLQPEKY